jgi:cyclic-di-GMP phosphodiesterase TipF (flagellum assembly factor)
MQKAVMALLTGAYIFVSFTIAALLWRAGAGGGAGIAALIGSLGFLFALHDLIGRRVDNGALRQEIERLKEAHKLLAEHLDTTQAALEGLADTLQEEAAAKTETLTGEVRMLEDLVERMGETLEARLTLARSGLGGGFEPSQGGGFARPDHQTAALLETVRDALAHNRVDLYLQPVVSLPQRRTVFYESFSRLRDDGGRVMMPAEYLSVAEPEGLVSAIDNLLLFRCVQIVRRLAKSDRKVGIFCNISLASLGDEVFFPQFLEFLAKNRDLGGALIFELGQNAFAERGSVEARNMAKLADLGFRFSLDKVTDLDLDFADLSRADVKFVKISADVLLEQLLEVEGRMALKSMRDLQASDFAALTRRYGVEVIAEKVEAERQVIDILELDVGYGQGHLFGEPRAIRDQVLAETAPPADFMQAALRRKAAGGR